MRAADPSHVDPIELLPQARAMALRHDPHARLAEIRTASPGRVDVRSTETISFTFEYTYVDSSRAPGEDQVEGSVRIGVRQGALVASKSPGAPRTRSRRAPAADPKCSAHDAWKAAVKSGVPENAVASMSYPPWKPSGPMNTWQFSVTGHREMDRWIDGTTCAIVRAGK